MKTLETVTLLGIDCLDLDRLILAANISEKHFHFAKTKLLSSIPSSDKRVIPIQPINSTEEYSEFVIRHLDDFIETEHVLIIQHDGFILNPNAWSDIFLDYDYIGAPWNVTEWSSEHFAIPKEYEGTWHVGNGGFSLRSKKLTRTLKELEQNGSIKTHHPEDVVICIHLKKLLEEQGITFAPVEIARQFSYEAEDKTNNKWGGEFGFHGLQWTDISKWLDAHPEYKNRIKNDLNW